MGPSTYSRSSSFDREADYGSNGPPTGPRGSFSQPTAAAAPTPFRPSNNTTATTYPRTQRFGPSGQALPTGPRSNVRETTREYVHPALANLAQPIEGGQRREPIIDRTKLDKLQAEAEKLRKEIEVKEAKKRKGLREWDRLGREVEVASLRSALAEESLRKLEGEGESQGAF